MSPRRRAQYLGSSASQNVAPLPSRCRRMRRTGGDFVACELNVRNAACAACQMTRCAPLSRPRHVVPPVPLPLPRGTAARCHDGAQDYYMYWVPLPLPLPCEPSRPPRTVPMCMSRSRCLVARGMRTAAEQGGRGLRGAGVLPSCCRRRVASERHARRRFKFKVRTQRRPRRRAARGHHHHDERPRVAPVAPPT